MHLLLCKTRVCYTAMGATCMLAVGLYLGSVLSNRAQPVRDAHVEIMSHGPIYPGGLYEIDVSALYLEPCEAEVQREQFDSNGQKFVLPTLMLHSDTAGPQHSNVPYRLPLNFAQGEGIYRSHVRYTCNWFQRMFWPLPSVDRMAHFRVEAAPDTRATLNQ